MARLDPTERYGDSLNWSLNAARLVVIPYSIFSLIIQIERKILASQNS
jgi:hypothetical protein